MNKIRILIALLFILLATTEIRAQQAVFIVRHAEEQKQVGDDSNLTEEGQQRAARLVELLKEAGITAVYTSEAKRTMQTAEPFAKALGVTARTAQRSDPAGLITRLRSEHRTARILIVGHRQNIPLLLKELGHPSEIKLGDVYNEMFVVVPRGEGQPVVMRLRF